MTYDGPINYGITVAGSAALPAGVNTTQIYARWVGYLIPLVTGVYTIGVNSDDGANLFIGGQPIVANLAASQGANGTLAYTQSGTINLTAGVYYDIVLEWQQGAGSYEIQLAWTAPGASIALIPSACLSTASNSVTGSLAGAWWNGTVLMWYPTGAGVSPVGYTGSWSSTVGYIIGDEVSYGGSFWKTLVVNTNSAPSTSNTNWQLMGTSATFIGAYSGSVAYVKDQQVSSSNNIYTCIAATTGNAPPNATYWTLMGPATLDSLANGSTYGKVNNTALTSGSIDPSKAGLLCKGGIPPAASGSISYSATSSAITWTWTSLVIYRADGTTTSITNGSFTDSSLTSSTAYYYYPYYNDATGAIGWVNGSGHGTNGYSFLNAQRSNTLTQTQNLQAYIPLSNGPITASTTASGTGGGSGGGGGGCVRHTMLVEERTKGIIPAYKVEVGDWLRTREGWTKVLFSQIREQDVFVRVTINGHSVEVTPTHPFIGMDENCEPILVIHACQLSLLHQLYTVDGADFVQAVKVVKVPSGKKMVIMCKGNHTFYSGETVPHILTHNVVPT